MPRDKRATNPPPKTPKKRKRVKSEEAILIIRKLDSLRSEPGIIFKTKEEAMEYLRTL